MGKTTTIAKLAGLATLTKNLTVGLITIDTHRVCGAEQLCSLGSIFGLSSAVVTDTTQFQAALEKFKLSDRIFIDTAGGSPTDREKLAEIMLYKSLHKEIDVTLLLSASGNVRDYRHILKSYNILKVSSLGVTKTDETCYFGPCLNVLLEAGLPVELFGTGQQIPDDIEPASAAKIVQMLLRSAN